MYALETHLREAEANTRVFDVHTQTFILPTFWNMKHSEETTGSQVGMWEHKHMEVRMEDMLSKKYHKAWQLK